MPENLVLSDDLGNVVANCRGDLEKTSEHLDISMEEEFGKNVERKANVTSIDDKVASNMGESSIISNILSMELDAWEDPSTLTDSLFKLLNESDEHHVSLKVPTLRKVQDKNQSRFSFARQDEFLNESSLEHSSGNTRHASSKYFVSGGFVGNNDTNIDKHQCLFPPSSSLESELFLGSQLFVPSKLSVSQAHVSTPPGFSVPSRTPPGFPSRGRVDQDSGCSVKLARQGYAPPTGNIGTTGDRRTSLPPFSPYEDDARFKLLRQQSISVQNFGFPDYVGNGLSSQNDAYRFSPRILDQFQPDIPPIYQQLPAQRFSNSHSPHSLWGGWNDVKNFSGLGMPEVASGLNIFTSVVSGREEQFELWA
ncbi:RNA binding (RRM/RBD/RNP motifs) family protein [Quillaja saponaria]|uniref:RNA binding (RRM/RBD/RNP motifs) family protein n=1 Tax=Quillaja saponaria TaxID=32244 RepID=A0AAD7Q062_QUISA|nr:RNA binding (RRM/RBD/RNP motifs) family protein [Quillaja saponaria]